MDRIGLDRELYEILKIEVPHITIPIRPGRDIARLIEVAAMDQKLKGLGLNRIGRRSRVVDTPANRGMIAKVAHLVRVVDGE